jgi:superfamily II DNA or RNA helicase
MDLRPYQQEAVEAVLDTAGRCVVKMFCGTGKSRVIVTVVLREGKPLSVVVFPSLALVQQFSTDYVMGSYVDQFANYAILNVSSEQLVEVQSTTEAGHILKFCEQTNPKLILVTYQSLEVLLFNLSGRTLDLICYDEAHHVVSLECQQLVFYNESIPFTTKQVFFTATPRNANGVTMQDREDPENNWCGPVACDYPYLAALEDDWLNSFDVCIDMYTDQSNRSVYAALARAILTRRTSRVLSFHSAVNGDNATSVWNFVDPSAFQTAWDQVCLDEFPSLVGVYRSITFVGMDGDTSTADRQRLLRQLDSTNDDEVFILSSCETIGEGVDTKRANLCLFADPKSSSTKIIQNIGRVVRRNAQCPVSTVLIPCFVNLDDYKGADRVKQDELIRENMRSAKGDNAMILNVLAALKQEDPDLYDMCLNCRPPTSSGASDPTSESEPVSDSDSVSDQPQTRERARQVGLSIHRSTDIGMLWGVDGSLDFTRKFCSVVISCEVSLGLERWREKLALVKQYLTTHRQAPSQKSKNPDTKTLGVWLVNQKQNYTNNARIMSNPAIRQEWENTLADPACGPYLKPRYNDQDWCDQLSLVKEYLTTHKKAPTPYSENHDTKTLGSWICTQKTNYPKNAQIMSNPAIRQEWENTLADPVYGSYLKVHDNEQDWRNKLALVKQYLKTYQQSPSNSSKNHETKSFAQWIGHQKQNYAKNAHSMSNPAIRQEWESTLADPAYGPYLQTNEQDWRDKLALVKQYLTTHQQAPSTTSKNPDTKNFGKWIGHQKQNYAKNAFIMSNPAIRQEWENALADPAYGPYLKPRDNDQDWRDQLALVKQYLTTHQQAPSSHSKNSDTKTLGIWINMQKHQYAKNIRIMSNQAIRQEWENTLAVPAYGSYLKPKDHDQDWRDQLALVEQYLTTHQKVPSTTSKNPDTKTLANWIYTQKQNYPKNAFIMSNPAIRQEWENILVDPAYGSYLVHRKSKSAPLVDTTAQQRPKKAKIAHPPKAYADLTEEERRRICELHLRQKAAGYQTTNPDTKDQINNVWADSCTTTQGAVIFLDHIEFRTAYALLAKGVLPENMLIPQRPEHYVVMSQHELFGSSVVLAEFNDVVASCLANGTLLAGVYADYCCTLEKAALPLLQLLADSKLKPGFVLGVTITLRNPEGVRFAGQDITTVERVLTKNWPASSNLLLLAGVTPDDNGPLTYGVGAPMATWLMRL